MQQRDQHRRVRDSQRQRVYDAETVWRQTVGTGEPLPTVPDVERFVRRVLTAKRVLRRWPFMQGHSVEVHSGAGCRSAIAEGDWRIKIPLWARNEAVVLHELAHVIHKRGMYEHITRQYGMRPPTKEEDPLWHQGHGYQFCRIFLDLVLLYMGKPAADQLKAAFKAGRVRYKAPRRLSPEQRLALANRLRRLRGEPIQVRMAA
jgi:putative metallohydrolase (TIGR04338 family)